VVERLSVEEAFEHAARLYEQAAEELEEAFEHAARLYDQAAEELEEARKHCLVAAEHFRNRQVPRGGAHAWAARGHLLAAGEHLDEQAKTHRLKSRAE
jgi:hypothetical protein